jgi:hypothetical protein
MARNPTIRWSTILLTALAVWSAVAAPAAGHPDEKLLPAGAVAPEILAINPFAFEGLEASDIQALRTSDVGRYCEGPGGFLCLLEAPVELPAGAVVSRLELDAFDAGSTDVKANFYRCPVGDAACVILAEVSTAGTPGATRVGVDLPVPEQIANQASTYLVEVYPGDDAVTRLLGVRLTVGGPESTASSDTLALNSYAFEGRTASDRNVLAADGIQRHCAGAPCTLVAPVELPAGAVVTRIELDAVDGGTADVTASFSRCGAASGVCTEVAAVSTTGTPGSTQTGFDLADPEAIDNDDFSYLAEVSLGATIDARLVGLRVLFDLPPALPRDDRLAINPFAFEARAAADSAVLDAQCVERFCNGQNCALLAPVELPSGTAVTRIELAAYDASSESVRAAFQRCPVGAGACTEVASAATTGNPGAVVIGSGIEPPEVVDNRQFSYAVEVTSGSNAATALRGVSLVIERALIFSDGFGTGDAAAWSTRTP